jgi:hypothetical protein
MRRLALCFVLLALAATCVARDETVAELKARVETARLEDRPDLCMRIAQLQERAADKLYNEGHDDEARAAIEDVAVYIEKAGDFAVQSKTHLKNVEIDARKVSTKLGDLKRALAFEDQAPVEQAIRRIETVRTQLLKEMFSNKKKEQK